MPLSIIWYNITYFMPGSWYYHRHHCFRDLSPVYTNNTANVSSVHQSTWSVSSTGPINEFACEVRFSSPTGLVVSGVQKQYSYPSYSRSFQSELFALARTYSSKFIQPFVKNGHFGYYGRY